MKKLPSPAPLALPRFHARWGLLLTLSLAAPAVQAQTLIDTSAAVGITNTLIQSTTTNDMGALQRANALKAKLQAQQAQQQQMLQQTTSAQATNNPSTSSPATSDTSTNSQGAGTITAPAAAPSAETTAAPAAPLVPTRPLSAQQQQLLAQARQNLSLSRPKVAQAAFEQLIAQNYQQPEAHFGLGLALFAQNNLKGAKFEFAQYNALAPQSFEGAYNLGVIAARQGDHNEALKQFTEAASKSAQGSPVARRQVLDALAGEQLLRSDYASLVTTLTQAQAIDPNDTGLQLRLGQAMTVTGKGTEALPLLYSAMQNPAQRADAAGLIADIYLAQNLPERALSTMNSAIAQASSDSERADLLLRKAQVQHRLKQEKAALGSVREALQLDSRSAAAQAALAQLLADQGDKSGSLQAWQKAAQLDSKNASYTLELSAAQLNSGQLAEAKISAQRAAKLSSDKALQARAELLQGISNYRQKNYADAVSHFKTSSMQQASADTSLWLGLGSYALKDYPGAIAAFSDSVKLQDTPAARLNLGAAYLASGRFKEAEPLLQSVVKLDSGNAQAWYQLGLARRALGNGAEARASFKMAAQLGYAAANAELK